MGLTYPSNKICPRCGTGGYVWYLDNSEFVAKCINCGHYFRREDFPMCVLDEAPKPITNADRIRAMTDEELADACVESVACFVCPMTFDCDGRKIGKDACRAKWLEWLKQEVET